MTRCEFCPKPATHQVRCAGMADDERINVCCECNYRHSDYGERCTPEDDCWTIDYSRQWREREARSARIAEHNVRCDACAHPRFCHENGGCEYAPGGRTCSCTGFIDLDLPFDFYPAVQLEGAAL